jgi:hypothetical protein
MREPALVVLFVNRTRLDREPKRGAIGGSRVAPDKPGQAVRQRAGANGGIERQRGLELLR